MARSRAAGKCGIMIGMPTAEAQALAGRLKGSAFEADDPIADRESLDRLASWCQRFSPLVNLESSERPESLYLDITGCAHLWGGEEGLATGLLEELSHYHLIARISIADTFGAAWGVAHYSSSKSTPRQQWIDQLTSDFFVVSSEETYSTLKWLPIEALRLPIVMIQTLHELGIYRIEQIEELSRECVIARFSPELLLRLDQAMGRAREILVPKDPPLEGEASWIFEYSVTHTAAVLDITNRLLRSLVGELRLGWGITLLDVLIRHELSDGALPVRQIPIGLCRPSARPDHILGLVQLALERTRLDGPVAEVRIQIKGSAPLEIFQGELFTSDRDQPDVREVASLIDRLTVRLGRQQVLIPRMVADAQPERCCIVEPASDRPSRSRKSAVPTSNYSPRRPLRLLTPPEPIDVHVLHPGSKPAFLRHQSHEEQISYSWGPERIETGWWRGRPIGRDYYQVELAMGHRLWIFRDLTSDRWFLHGAFE